ncbi:Protein free1 [Ancistrocladus abbreviatus]
MGGRSSRPADSLKVPERAAEKKKGLGDWMNLLKPANEEKDHWHHCRNCGDIFCDKCTHGRIALTADENAQPVRVCDRCMAEVTQRLSNVKEAANKPAVQSHEDPAKMLQDEMEKNRRAASGSESDGSGKHMKEVACPTCIVHLQVQVPRSGSETIECGVCQHPFLVRAH